MKFRCRICGNESGNRLFIAKEKMFGIGDEFDYYECPSCGCLQIKSIPSDISRYHPSEYYSFTPSQGIKSWFVRFLRGKRLASALGRKNLVGGFLIKFFGIPPQAQWFLGTGVTYDSEILDVGSGDGYILQVMYHAGFSNLTGIDPFISKDIYYDNGVRVFKRGIHEVNKTYDFVMLHHSFEHMPDPLKTLISLRRILKASGLALIRIPVAGCFAWRKYGTDWVQLDAPRHFFLHTEKSLLMLAQKAGLQIERVIYDSTAFQFVGSEQYRKGIPLADKRFNTYQKNSPEFHNYEKKAEELNARGDGDQACFFLRRSG